MTKRTPDSKVTEPQSARAEVERLNIQELGIAVLVRQKADELREVRAERGDQVLAADDPTSAAQENGRRVTAMIEEIDALVDASKRARERRLAAIPAVYQAEAAEKERQAEQLEVEATRLEAESRSLREALEKHDDWCYFPAEGMIDGRYYQAIPHGNGEYRVIDGRGPGFKRLVDRAQVLRQEAVQVRLKTPHQAGGVEADTLEALLDAVFSDAMRIGPTIDSIRDWAERAIAGERRRRERITSGDNFVALDAPIRLRLQWRAGTIDVAGSEIAQVDPTEVRYFDMASEMGVSGDGKPEPAQVEAV